MSSFSRNRNWPRMETCKPSQANNCSNSHGNQCVQGEATQATQKEQSIEMQASYTKARSNKAWGEVMYGINLKQKLHQRKDKSYTALARGERERTGHETYLWLGVCELLLNFLVMAVISSVLTRNTFFCCSFLISSSLIFCCSRDISRCKISHSFCPQYLKACVIKLYQPVAWLSSLTPPSIASAAVPAAPSSSQWLIPSPQSW